MNSPTGRRLAFHNHVLARARARRVNEHAFADKMLFAFCSRGLVFTLRARAFTVASLLLVAGHMPVTLPSPIPWPCPRCETNYGIAQEHMQARDVTWYRCPICDNAWSVRTYRKRNAADESVAEPITS